MARVVSQLTGAEWELKGPTTPSQRFFKQYIDAIDSKGHCVNTGLKFYSKNMAFHNQHNSIYHGGEEIWAWMEKLFGAFELVHHDWTQVLEIDRGDGLSLIHAQNTRNLWVIGHKAQEPTARIPVTTIAIIGKSDHKDSPEGLHFKEIWLY